MTKRRERSKKEKLLNPEICEVGGDERNGEEVRRQRENSLKRIDVA